MVDRTIFDIQGHRFARGLFPENTAEGFDAACGVGLTSFEIDVAVTRDGVPVLHHDPALNPDTTRGPDGAWLDGPGPLVKDLTLAELSRYDVGRLRPGSAYADRYGDQVPHDGARVPTLDAVLRRRPDIRFNIELKLIPAHPEWTASPDEMVEHVLAVINRADAAGRVMIQSFDWRAPRHCRKLRPNIPCGWLTEASTIRDAPLWRGLPAAAVTIDAVPDAIMAEGGGTWTPFHAELTPLLLARAHDYGLRVVPWTVNDPADMRRLRKWGVDGLITDRPDRTLALDPAAG